MRGATWRWQKSPVSSWIFQQESGAGQQPCRIDPYMSPEPHYLPPVSLQLITRHWFRRSEHEKKQLGPSCPRDLNQQPRYRLAAAQLPFMSSCCGRVHVKYGTLNKEFYRHEIGPILADELFTAFWQGMAVVVKP